MRLFSVTLLLSFVISGYETQERIVVKNQANSIITPKGNIITFRSNGSIYQLQWRHGNKLETLEHKFSHNAADAHRPRFISESKEYILLRAGCGNPCWQGILLPLNAEGSPKIISEYLAYDLEQYLVAYVKGEHLCVLNFKTGKNQVFKLAKCQSAFYGYCIDKMYFNKKELVFKWAADTDVKSDKPKFVKLKLKV